MKRSFFIGLGLVFFGLTAKAENEYELPPIRYSDTQPKDATQELAKLMTAGQVKLDRRNAWTILKGLREYYQIPEESQVLVFSKTSKQNDFISPSTPRAIYFSDNAYLGYSVGGSIEVSTIDPVLGPIFYVLDPHPGKSQPLQFHRDQSCLSCHGGPYTPEVPGLLVRSVFPDADGHPILSQGTTVVDTTTPFGERWGGWYVTGKHGEVTHRGNVTATEKDNNTCDMPVEKGANITELAAFFDTRPYPRAQSDIVALMVLEHQSAMQNLLTKANHTAKRAMHMQMSLQKELGEPVQTEPQGSAQRIISHCVENVLDGLFFKDEAALPEGGIEGAEDFQQAFTQAAPKSPEGRSLKDFQLLNRLFKYRCSYMIYSLTFQHLEPALKKQVMARVQEVLEGRDTEKRYDYLSSSERRHIRRILAGTLPGTPASWKEDTTP